MYCGKCGSEVSNGSLYCNMCGKSLTGKKSKGFYIAIGILAAVLVALIVTAVAVFVGHNSQVKKLIGTWETEISLKDFAEGDAAKYDVTTVAEVTFTKDEKFILRMYMKDTEPVKELMKDSVKAQMLEGIEKLKESAPFVYMLVAGMPIDDLIGSYLDNADLSALENGFTVERSYSAYVGRLFIEGIPLNYSIKNSVLSFSPGKMGMSAQEQLSDVVIKLNRVK